MKFNSILDTVGNTPLVKLNKLAPEGVNVWVKVEAFNPMGSVKDRMAPDFSASSIMASAMRSLTEPMGLKASTFTQRFTPSGASMSSLTSGVLPMVSRMLLYIIGVSLLISL